MVFGFHALFHSAFFDLKNLALAIFLYYYSADISNIFLMLIILQSIAFLYIFYRGHPVVLILTIILYIKQSANKTFSMYLITIDIQGY